MPFNIQEFSSEVGRRNVARVPHFMVGINGPIPSPVEMRLRIETVSFPGRQINSFEYRSYGPPYKIGYAEQYGEVSMSILLSPNFQEKLFFQRWQDLIVGMGRGATSEKPRNI